jgi:hypothetical protein
MHPIKRLRGYLYGILICISALAVGPAAAQSSPSPELLEARARLLEAETRQAVAEAERAELLARLPPAQTRALSGAVDTRQFGAAGLARAFDLALELASQLCATLPPERHVTMYHPGAAQGVVAARTVDAALGRMAAELAARNGELARIIEQHTPQANRSETLAPALAWLTAPAMTLRAVADVSSLFKSDATLAGIAYGDGARALFASALARSCPARLIGLGDGYMGELDTERHARLLERVRLLGQERGVLAAHVGQPASAGRRRQGRTEENVRGPGRRRECAIEDGRRLPRIAARR